MCKNVSIVEDLDTSPKMCRQNLDSQDSDKTEFKHIDIEEQSLDFVQSEYTTPYYLTNDQVKGISQMPQDYSQSPLHISNTGHQNTSRPL